jgi:hypothetical protein
MWGPLAKTLPALDEIRFKRQGNKIPHSGTVNSGNTIWTRKCSSMIIIDSISMTFNDTHARSCYIHLQLYIFS